MQLLSMAYYIRYLLAKIFGRKKRIEKHKLFHDYKITK